MRIAGTWIVQDRQRRKKQQPLRIKLRFMQSWSRWSGVALSVPMLRRSSFGTEKFSGRRKPLFGTTEDCGIL